jgi:hypothetical protein
MSLRSLAVFAALMIIAVAASAQPFLNAAVPSAFQVKYVSNLAAGASYINIVNDGASATVGNIGQFASGNICVQVYGFDQGEELQDCCTCTITPNGIASFTVGGTTAGLFNGPGSTANGQVPTSAVVKLVSTSVARCDAAVAVTTAQLADGMHAWGTALHKAPGGTFATTETEFSRGDLSAAEYTHLTNFCAFIESNQSGFGVCPGCAQGALGANTQL